MKSVYFLFAVALVCGSFNSYADNKNGDDGQGLSHELSKKLANIGTKHPSSGRTLVKMGVTPQGEACLVNLQSMVTIDIVSADKTKYPLYLHLEGVVGAGVTCNSAGKCSQAPGHHPIPIAYLETPGGQVKDTSYDGDKFSLEDYKIDENSIEFTEKTSGDNGGNKTNVSFKLANGAVTEVDVKNLLTGESVACSQLQDPPPVSSSTQSQSQSNSNKASQ